MYALLIDDNGVGERKNYTAFNPERLPVRTGLASHLIAPLVMTQYTGHIYCIELFTAKPMFNVGLRDLFS